MSRNIVKPFTVSGKGSTEGRLYDGLLVPGNPIFIFDEQGTMINFSSATIPGVDAISTVYDRGFIYDYTIEVTGGCPKGYVTLLLKFTDESNDSYSLSITSSTIKKHTVNFNSVKPNMKEISWELLG